jgi:hypothetical protein
MLLDLALSLRLENFFIAAAVPNCTQSVVRKSHELIRLVWLQLAARHPIVTRLVLSGVGVLPYLT